MFNRNKAKTLLNKLEKSITFDSFSRNVKLSDNSVWNDIQSANENIKLEIAILALKKLVKSDFEERNFEILRKKIFRNELNRNGELKKETIQRIFKILLKSKDISILPINEILTILNYYKNNFGEDFSFKSVINFFNNKYKNKLYPSSESKKLIAGISGIIHKDSQHFCFNTSDIIGSKIKSDWIIISDEIQNIICHCWKEPHRSKPTKSWLQKSKILINQSNELETQISLFSKYFDYLAENGKTLVKKLNSENRSIDLDDILTGIINITISGITNKLKKITDNIANGNQGEELYLNQENEIGISYLVWYCSLIDSKELNSSINRFAITSFLKIKDHGSLSTRNGNACLIGFTLMPKKIGISYLLNIKNKTLNRKIKKLASNHINRIAEELKISQETLLEISTPDFGLKNNLIEHKFGEFKGIIDTSELKKPIIYWINLTTNKKQKSIPKTVKENYKTELKALKEQKKEFILNYNIHKTRLENSFINDEVWSIEEWKKYYIDHQFLSRFNSILIWQFDKKYTAIKIGDSWVDSNFNLFKIENIQTVRLWHPIYSSINTVQKWREFVVKNEIKQPFKQAFREIYKVTEAELQTSTYSNRFAAHILYQHQFNALAKIRNWVYSLQGGFDSYNTPTISIPKFNMTAEFWVEAIEDSLNEMSIYSYISSDQVRFYSDNVLKPIENVPEIIFTEIMRDIDMFVGVCSIGNNPEWHDGGETREYWNNYSFGELSNNAETRKAVLEMIIPKLSISKQCKITNKYLEVKGDLRTYKIHIGSGNILMSPNDEYLCIVPSNTIKNQKIFLPFDDDKTLSIILSKAFLLAKDTKIKDRTILNQISIKP